MASDNSNYHEMDLEDEHNLESVVDEFFSFIDEDFNLGSDGDGSSCVSDLDEAKGISSSQTKTPVSPDKLNLDNVLDEHFSFLKDEPTTLVDESEEFYSLGKHTQSNSLDLVPQKDSSDALDGESVYENISFESKANVEEEEPIYSNLDDIKELVKKKNESQIAFEVVQELAESRRGVLEECPYQNVQQLRDKNNIKVEDGFGRGLERDRSTFYQTETSAVITIPVHNATSEVDVMGESPSKCTERKSSVYLTTDQNNDDLVHVNSAFKPELVLSTSDLNLEVPCKDSREENTLDRKLYCEVFGTSHESVKQNSIPDQTHSSDINWKARALVKDGHSGNENSEIFFEPLGGDSDSKESDASAKRRDYRNNTQETLNPIISEPVTSGHIADRAGNTIRLSLSFTDSERDSRGLRMGEVTENERISLPLTGDKEGQPEDYSSYKYKKRQRVVPEFDRNSGGSLEANNKEEIKYESVNSDEEYLENSGKRENEQETEIEVCKTGSETGRGTLRKKLLSLREKISDPVLDTLMDVSSPDLQKYLEKLYSFDMEIEQLESLDRDRAPSREENSQSSSTDPVAEAINSDIMSTDNSSMGTFPSNLTLNTNELGQGSSVTEGMFTDGDFKDEPGCSRAVARGRDELHLCLAPSETSSTRSRREFDRKYFSLDDTKIESRKGDLPCQNMALQSHNSADVPDVPNGLCSEAQEGTNSDSNGIAGVIRRSMRRMRHIRLSGRKGKRKSKVSEETEVRREVPSAPEIGLPSVRSPSSSAVLIPSLLAALTPTDPPRESLPTPTQVLETNNRSNSADYSTSAPCHRSRDAINPTNDGSRGERSLSNDEGRRRTPENPNHRSISVISSNSTPDSLLIRVSADLSNSPGVGETPLIGVNSSPVPVHGRRDNNTNGRTSNNSNSNNNRRGAIVNRPRTRSRNVNNSNSNGNNNNNNNNNSNNAVNNNTRSPSRTTSTSSRLSSNGDDSSSRTAARRNSGTHQQRTHQQPHIPSSRRAQRAPSSSEVGFLPPKRSLWPHTYSGLMASLAVSLNLFNISRFAVLGAEFGWQFTIQWVIISLVIGLPLMSFHSALGQSVGGSVIDVWVVSPIFRGVGIGLLLVETVLGIYCCVPVAWLFTYFRDSFDVSKFRCLLSSDCVRPQNLTDEINTEVAGYFSKTVLQRNDESSSLILERLGSIKFDLSFNIALIWVITFLALSRGVRSYGKFCFFVFLLPLACFVSVGFYLVYWTNSQISINQFQDIFIDRHSWMAASREAFLVWGLHGAVFQQMASANKKNHPLWRDTTVIALVTIFGLGLASVCGLVFTSVLRERDISYISSSFETEESRSFIKVETQKPLDAILPERRQTMMRPPHYYRDDPIYDNFYVGIRIRDDYWGMPRYNEIRIKRSGYNCIRFMTEMFPALVFAKENVILGFWPPLFYLGLLLFGLAHQLAVWHTVVQGVVRINYAMLSGWETFITFGSCVFAFSTSLLMSTGLGIHMIYFLDYVIGCVWWIMILQLIMVFAVLFVRGKPYTAQSIAKNMFGNGNCCTSWVSGPLAFSWTIMVPVGLLVLSISSFKTGNYREVFAWESKYWSTWACQIASTMQLFPLLLVPLVGLIQTCRFLADPKRDLFERIQHLYRPPPFRGFENGFGDDDALTQSGQDDGDDYDGVHSAFTGSEETLNGRDPTQGDRPFNDPPPKYTPPPSYSTATGSGFTKFFNHSLRRSVRRLRNTLLSPSAGDRSDLEASNPNPDGSQEPYIPPPDYTHPTLRGRSPGPPQYATLDPIRFQRALRAIQSSKNGEVTRDTETTNGDSNTRDPSHRPSTTLSSNSNERSASQENVETIFSLQPHSTPLVSSRSFSPSDSVSRRSSRLRRSLTSSLRRSARRMALNLTSGIVGDTSSRNSNSSDSAALVYEPRPSSTVLPNRSLSNLEISTQSEA